MKVKLNFFDEVEFCIEKDRTALGWEELLRNLNSSIAYEYIIHKPNVVILDSKPCIVIETQINGCSISEVEKLAKRVSNRYEIEEYDIFVIENNGTHSIVVVSDSYLNDEDVSVINRVIESEVEGI